MAELNPSCPSPPNPGDLWNRTIAQTDYALKTGALQPIPTQFEQIEQGGIQFLVRTLDSLARKAAAQKAIQQASPKQPRPASSGQPFNPFLPYDPDLFVADLSETHLCLLNKYNVTDHHLLIVTRAFEPQEALLTQSDFVALWRCLAEIDGLGFYNSGKQAGASQPHRHLQLVPLPLAELKSSERIPIEAALAETVWQDNQGYPIGSSPMLPFRHALIQMPWQPNLSDLEAAQISQAAYETLIAHLNLNGDILAPYNLAGYTPVAADGAAPAGGVSSHPGQFPGLCRHLICPQPGPVGAAQANRPAEFAQGGGPAFGLSYCRLDDCFGCQEALD